MPMTPPPSNRGSVSLEATGARRQYQHLSGVKEEEASVSCPAVTLSSAIDTMDKVPVVKTKATRGIMNALITKHTQESIQCLEQQAGLRGAGYTLHKGLTTQETKDLRVAEALHTLKRQSGERTREERREASAQPIPQHHPPLLPCAQAPPRGWFPSGSSTALPGPNLSTMHAGNGDKDKISAPRSLQKSDSGGFATQACRGAWKPPPVQLIRVQAPDGRRSSSLPAAQG